MGNFISFLQEIFLGKETDITQIGLSELKKKQAATMHAIKRKSLFPKQKPQELRLSELIRKGSC